MGDFDRGRDRLALLSSMIRPKSVAVLGASARRKASGNEAIANLKARGFGGDLVAVHREAHRIDGVEAVPHVEDLPRDLDVALVSLPPPAVLPALRALASRECRSAIVPTVGLSEHDAKGFALLARTTPMAIHGPNSMGILNFTDGIPLWFYDRILTEEPPGSSALVSQSGSACLFIVRASPTVQFSKVISSGNELGISMADYLAWLAEDPSTTRVGVVIESLKDVDGFTSAVDKLRKAGKPVVALKVGRSRNGVAATIAHTGALVGAAAAYDCLFEELDIPTVNDYDEMAATLECLSTEQCASAPGSRVAVVTISGGQAAMAADLAEANGVPLADFCDDTTTRLMKLAPGSVPVNPFDIGASSSVDKSAYADALEALAGDAGVDAVLVVLDAAHTLNDAEIAYARECFEASAQAASRKLGKPIIIASSSSLAIHPACRAWTEGVPVLRGIPSALVAIRGISKNRTPVPSEQSASERPVDYDGLRAELLTWTGPLSHHLSRRLLHAYGLPLVPSVLAPDADAAVNAAEKLGYPVVVKLSSPDIAHRLEVGGVVVGAKTADSVRAAVEEIACNAAVRAPTARITGFEVQRLVPTSLEATVGFIADPVFGAIMMVGTGGTLVELLADTAVAAAPLTRASARRMLARTRLAHIASGYRELSPPTPLDALADAVVALSRLAADFSDLLTQGDLNPVLVEYENGHATVVDVLLVAGGVSGSGARV